ncbi:hypothetical protein ACIOJE_20325 [Kitasatospora sp. NPDC087861]|uniref:hypothetical protein n=1 Tax=Kitasatospora sp. NPDC087861 TaxID=3364070 RepID=UPI0038097D19
MTVRLARPADLPGFLALAAEVEHRFGPMVAEPGFVPAEAAPAGPEGGSRQVHRRHLG